MGAGRHEGRLELPGGRTPAGGCARIAQRILALVAAIWHNDQTGTCAFRSLLAYDYQPLEVVIQVTRAASEYLEQDEEKAGRRSL